MTLDAYSLEPSPIVRRVEHRAQACLHECQKALDLEHLPLPIPVERWIEHPLGIRFGITDLSEYGDDVLGATFIKDNEILVSERLVRNPARLRFTAAHELGHFTLHASKETHFRETTLQGPGSPIQIERQADRFAAAFLMPADLLAPQLELACDYFALDATRCMPVLSEDSEESYWLWRHRLLPRLTQRFEVSLAALLHRFTELRLPSGAPFLSARLKSRLLRPPSTCEQCFTVADGVPVPAPSEQAHGI